MATPRPTQPVPARPERSPPSVAQEPVVLDAERAASAMIYLHDAPFGGQPAGRRFRMSHASLREITGRPVLGAHFLDEVAMQMARAGYDLIRMEAYVVVQQARQHRSLRRAPASFRKAARDAAATGRARLIPIAPDVMEETD